MRLLPESPLWRVATAGISLLYRVDPTNPRVPNHTGDDTSPTPIGFVSVNHTKVGMTRLPDVEQWRQDVGYSTLAALFVWSAGGSTATSAAEGAPTQRARPS